MASGIAVAVSGKVAGKQGGVWTRLQVADDEGGKWQGILEIEGCMYSRVSGKVVLACM